MTRVYKGLPYRSDGSTWCIETLRNIWEAKSKTKRRKKNITKKNEDRFGVQNAQRHKRTSRVWKIKSENWVNPVFTFPTINKGNCIVDSSFDEFSLVLTKFSMRKKPSRTKISPFSSMNIWTKCVRLRASVCSRLEHFIRWKMCGRVQVCVNTFCYYYTYSRRLIDVWIAVRSTFHGTDWLHRQEIASIHANHFLFKQNFVQHVHTF